MRNHIFVLARIRFKNQLKELSEQQFMNGAFISIHEPDHPGFPDILESAENVLNLRFHDAEEPNAEIENPVLFNDKMANTIVEFIEKNKAAKFWLIHCTMGISRSGAVGEVLSEYFDIPYTYFKRDNPRTLPNVLVKTILRNKLIIK